jgi:glycosyltransferase involved in cell wall biosynthesis
MVIVDDSAAEGVFEKLVEEYGSFCDVICFPRNRSQWWAMDFMVSYCDSEYIFYLEDDWEFISTGYLGASKRILKKYREIATVDISWRTFEGQGIDSYDKTLVTFKSDDDYDVSFYHKKPWQITPYHLKWYGWVGSPNLKRRDDLIMLGRVEKWHNEWNIDRKFMGMGFRAVFLQGQYVVHLGDHCSAIASRRPDDTKVPEDFIPPEIKANRTFPAFNYRFLDTHLRHPHDITLVSMMVDLNRNDRTFEEHYLEGIKKLLKTRHQLILHCDEKYFDLMKELRGDQPLQLVKFDLTDIEKCDFFYATQELIAKESWINQSAWMKDSVIGSRYYIPMTLMKQRMLCDATLSTGSNYLYWLDSGMFSSYHVTGELEQFYLEKIPKDKFFMASFPYYTTSEIHGYNINGMIKRCGRNPGYVCRATLFGGAKEQIQQITNLYNAEIVWALRNGYIGTEESIYTILSVMHPDLFNIMQMPNGDMKNCLETLR